MTIDTSTAATKEIQSILLGAVAPRPIALAGTIDKEGRPNLSPFSFFNAFSANPPVLVFSPARRGTDGTTKDTFENIKEVDEVVINVVTEDIVEQASLSSGNYPKGVNEYEKAGFTALPSESVKPFRVKESPVQFECKVMDVIELGDQGGAGNLVICRILKIHINDDILDDQGRIINEKIKLVGRMGGNDYIKAFGNSLFQIPKPVSTKGVGIDALPPEIKSSKHLTGNILARIGSLEKLPEPKVEVLKNLKESDFIYAARLVESGDTEKAVLYLFQGKTI